MRDLNEAAPMSQAAFEAMMRRWVMKISVRYVPVAAVALAVGLILIFVPTTQPGNGLSGGGGNLALGTNRSETVKSALVQAGVAANRIKTISYGKEKPFCTEHNEQCWQQNRVGHLVYSK